MTKNSQSAKMLIALMATAGVAALGWAAANWQSADLVRFASFLVVTILASRLKISLPGLNGNMSVNLPFILIGMVELSGPEAVVLAGASTLVQCWPVGAKGSKPVQMLFNIANMMAAVAVASLVFQQVMHRSLLGESLGLAVATVAFLVADTVPVAGIISLTEAPTFVKVWGEILLLTFPYFVLSAGVAGLVSAGSHYVGWQAPLLVLPVMYGVYRSFNVYFGRTRQMMQSEETFTSSAAAD